MEPLATVIVIHGYQGVSDDSWKPWLTQSLQSEQVTVRIPDMPDPGHPDERAWLDTIESEVDRATTPIILVGHSLGGLAVLRWLETRAAIPIQGAVLVAGVTDPTAYDAREYSFVTEWAAPQSWDAIRSKTRNLVGLYSNDDTDVPMIQGEQLEQQGQAQLLKLNGYHHFSEDDHVKEVPELLQVIETLVQLAK